MAEKSFPSWIQYFWQKLISDLKGETIEFVQGLEILKSTGQTENKQHIFNRVIEDVANIQRIGTKKANVRI